MHLHVVAYQTAGNIIKTLPFANVKNEHLLINESIWHRVANLLVIDRNL